MLSVRVSAFTEIGFHLDQGLIRLELHKVPTSLEVVPSAFPTLDVVIPVVPNAIYFVF